MDDIEIIELYWQRNERALQETQKKYGSYCTTIANRILASPEDSEECVQDAYLRAWNTIPPQRPRYLRAYLVRITRNLALNRLKSMTAQRRGAGMAHLPLEELHDLVGSDGDPLSELEKKRLADSIGIFLRVLPAEKQKLFLLRYWYLESLSEIASQTHLSEDKIRNDLFRIRKKLKNHLEKEGFTP